jgi:hypothetical protein
MKKLHCLSPFAGCHVKKTPLIACAPLFAFGAPSDFVSLAL